MVNRAGRMLVALGPHVAPEVLACLAPAEVTDALVLVAATEPDHQFEYLDPGLEVAAWMATQRALSKEGPREARRVAEQVWAAPCGDDTLDDVDRLWDEPVVDRCSREAPHPEAGRHLAEALARADGPGAALALSLAPRALARRALVDLVDAGRPEVALWLACLDNAFPHVMTDPEQGEEILSELLDGLRVEVRERVLHAIRLQDPGLWQRLYDRGFTLRELEGLGDGNLADLLSQVPAEDVGLALREAPEQLRQRCMRCLPRGMRNQVTQALDRGDPVRLRDLEKARERLGAVCRGLGLRGGELAAV